MYDATVPVWTIAKRSYAYVWQQRGLLALPFAIILAVQIVAGLAFQLIAPLLKLSFLPSFALSLFWQVAIGLFVMSYTVGLHRTVLLEEVRTGFAFLRWDRYLWNYFKAALMLVATIVAVLAILATAIILIYRGNAGFLLMMIGSTLPYLAPIASIAFLLLMLKIGLGFPAAALGYQGVFTLSWRITEDNALRLLAVFLLVYLPFWGITLASLLPLIPVLKTLAVTRLLPAGFGVLALAWGLFGAVISAISLSVLTVASSLSFFFLFKAADFETA